MYINTIEYPTLHTLVPELSHTCCSNPHRSIYLSSLVTPLSTHELACHVPHSFILHQLSHVGHPSARLHAVHHVHDSRVAHELFQPSVGCHLLSHLHHGWIVHHAAEIGHPSSASSTTAKHACHASQIRHSTGACSSSA
ncbi:hypothetical protein BDV98DRAFT_559281 [Pterulicium gracile]|uniref:Uncharacterized protein n=1 Tax=Pterulicium gracile TaxID=1884261 RepID=A0A5C3QWK2_9AGAR|nr:hypothetical protein BDV98DRAFT_559281 [Pterula gracilis]